MVSWEKNFNLETDQVIGKIILICLFPKNKNLYLTVTRNHIQSGWVDNRTSNMSEKTTARCLIVVYYFGKIQIIILRTES